jgi:large subunit ribosomal protein L1
MAKKKADYLAEAEALSLDVTAKNTVAEIQAAIKAVGNKAGDTKEKPTAKAGKRSAKAIREAEELAEKEARKAQDTEPEEVAAKKGPIPVPRPKIERRSNRYQAAAKLVDSNQLQSLDAAIETAIKTSTVRFDASVEVHIRLNVDPKQSDQNIRGTVALPHGTGKTVRVAVFAPTDLHEKATKAGADIVGEADFLNTLKKEELNFDILISTPEMMSQLGRFAKLLGPKGLMPNPKSGTVTKNVEAAVKQAKAGQVEFRVDKQGIVHVAVGKVSFGKDKLIENAQTVLNELKSSKPSSIKGAFVESAHVTSSMGPSIKLDPAEVLS